MIKWSSDRQNRNMLLWEKKKKKRIEKAYSSYNSKHMLYFIILNILSWRFYLQFLLVWGAFLVIFKSYFNHVEASFRCWFIVNWEHNLKFLLQMLKQRLNKPINLHRLLLGCIWWYCFRFCARQWLYWKDIFNSICFILVHENTAQVLLYNMVWKTANEKNLWL